MEMMPNNNDDDCGGTSATTTAASSNLQMQVAETFLIEQHGLRRDLHNQMMLSLREMVNADLEGHSKLKHPARASIASISNLSLYLTAHHRLLSSFLRDIADAKIYKMSRKIGKGKSTKKKKLSQSSQLSPLLPPPLPQAAAQQQEIPLPPPTTMIKEELLQPIPPPPLDIVKNEVEDEEDDESDYDSS